MEEIDVVMETEQEKKPEKKPGFFKKLFEKKSGQILFFVVSMAVIVLLYNALYKIGVAPKEKRDQAMALDVLENYEILASVQDLEVKNKKIIVSGWVSRKGSAIDEIYVTIREIGTENEIMLTTEIYSNVDSIGQSSTYSFQASTNESEIENDICYEILVSVFYEDEQSAEYKQEKISVRRYIYNEQVYKYNPKVFYAPSFLDKKMKTIISAGDLCAYNEKLQMWIYLYQGNMYWIADEGFPFDESGKTYIPFQLYTYNVIDLPENRQKSKFDNKDFYFEDMEIRLENEQFRVAVNELPREYEITYIISGLYDLNEKKLIWRAKISQFE